MRIDMRYVESRRNANGTLRWYWIRRGFPIERLADDPAKRWSQAEKLNAMADSKPSEPADHTISSIIDDFENSRRFLRTASATQRIYRRWLREFRTRWGDDHPSLLTRYEIVNFIGRLEDQPSTQRHAVATLTRVLDRALYYGLVEQNYARRLELAPAGSRAAYWQPEQVETWLRAAADHESAVSMRLAFLLLLYTAQRPIDVLQMTWAQFDGETIRLRQKKTKRLAEIPCHVRLRQELLAAERVSTRIVPFRGTARWAYAQFNDAYREICRSAGITGLQARDLRRTAVVKLSEAGCNLPQVSSITGHSIERTQKIIDTYFVRTLPQAREAIRRWEAHDKNIESNVTPQESNV